MSYFSRTSFESFTLSQIRGTMDGVQYELVGEAGQAVQVGAWLLCRGVQQQGPGCQVISKQPSISTPLLILIRSLYTRILNHIKLSAWMRTPQNSQPSPPLTIPTLQPRSCGSQTARSCIVKHERQLIQCHAHCRVSTLTSWRQVETI